MNLYLIGLVLGKFDVWLGFEKVGFCEGSWLVVVVILGFCVVVCWVGWCSLVGC